MAPPRVLVTRPARDAQHWAAQLRQRLPATTEVLALPLLDIAALPSPALDAARARWALGRYRALMFVSGHAVAGFFEQNRPSALMEQAREATKTRAWSPGPGTARALLAAGYPAALIDSPAPEATQFDSEALWRSVGPQVRPGDSVLIVRGATADADTEGPTDAPPSQGHGREWLARRIAAAGGTADTVAAYQRCAPAWSAAQAALARAAAHDGTLWLFSSSEAVGHLRTRLAGQTWGSARALATHERIAQAAHSLGFGDIRVCRPSLDDVVASIESS